MELDPKAVLAQYGLAGLFALIVGWICYRVGLRMIASLDKLGEKWEAASKLLSDRIDDHTRTDVEYHNDVAKQLERIEARIDTALELTPVRPMERSRERVKTDPQGIPEGRYSLTRPRTRNEGDR